MEAVVCAAFVSVGVTLPAKVVTTAVSITDRHPLITCKLVVDIQHASKKPSAAITFVFPTASHSLCAWNVSMQAAGTEASLPSKTQVVFKSSLKAIKHIVTVQEKFGASH